MFSVFKNCLQKSNLYSTSLWFLINQRLPSVVIIKPRLCACLLERSDCNNFCKRLQNHQKSVIIFEMIITSEIRAIMKSVIGDDCGNNKSRGNCQNKRLYNFIKKTFLISPGLLRPSLIYILIISHDVFFFILFLLTFLTIICFCQ